MDLRQIGKTQIQDAYRSFIMTPEGYFIFRNNLWGHQVISSQSGE